jgi:RNA polymerase sigma-70 factor, ECF subfamily
MQAGTRVVEDAVLNEMVALLPRLRRFACGLAGSLADADDLVQGACLRALDRIEQWRPGTRLDSWMFRILQNLWIDQLRERRGREVAMDPDDLAERAVGDAARENEARIELAQVRREIAKLAPEQRAVLMLVSVEGVSYKEAAEILEIPIGTVMSRLARARLALGRAIGGEAAAGAVA